MKKAKREQINVNLQLQLDTYQEEQREKRIENVAFHLVLNLLKHKIFVESIQIIRKIILNDKFIHSFNTTILCQKKRIFL